jgi:hypothetical protein
MGGWVNNFINFSNPDVINKNVLCKDKRVMYQNLFKNALCFASVKILNHYLKFYIAKIIILSTLMYSIGISSANPNTLSGVGLSYKHGCLEQAAWMASADKRELYCHCVATAFVNLKGDLDIQRLSLIRAGLTKYGVESELRKLCKSPDPVCLA